MVQVPRPSMAFAALLAGGLALLLASIQTLSDSTLQHNLGNVAALKQIMGESVAPANTVGASNYLAGVTAYQRGDYATAVEQLHIAKDRYGPFARHWLALSFEREGESATGRQILNVDNDAELALYGEILLREWTTASTTDKTNFLTLLKERRPNWVLQFANRLIDTNHMTDAAMWAAAVPNYESSPGALLALGTALFMDGSVDRGTTILKRAYETGGNSMTAYRYGVALNATGVPEKGAAVLEQAIDVAASDDRLRPLLLYELGIGYALSGRCSDATAALERSAAADHSDTHQARVAAAVMAFRGRCSGQ